MQRQRKLKPFICILLLAAGCGKRAPVSPMRNDALVSSAVFKIAIFNKGTRLDRTVLENCPQEYPGLEVLDETSVHRAARDAGMTPDQLLSLGDDIRNYDAFKDFQLLLLAFKAGGKDYLRIVNTLGHYVSTVVLDIPKPSCKDILAGQRIAVIDSVPPFADIELDSRTVGQAPRWIWLKDGNYQFKCTLPGQVFKPVKLVMPRDQKAFCQREDTMGKPDVKDDGDKMSAEEGAGAVLIYLLGIAGTVAAIVLPILFLL